MLRSPLLRRPALAGLRRPGAPARPAVVVPDAEVLSADEGLWRVLCGCGARRSSRSPDELMAWLEGHTCRAPAVTARALAQPLG